MNTDEQAVTDAVRTVFRAGEDRDFARLRTFHAEDPAFSRWSNRPGGELLDIAAAHEEEEAAFGALTPGTHVAPEQIRVDLFGPVAVSTFLVHVTAPDGAVLRRRRGTLVWRHDSDGWRIVHEHFSP
jgi:ketosteroid isomerase-like protein